jgi:hypothetical protein
MRLELNECIVCHLKLSGTKPAYFEGRMMPVVFQTANKKAVSGLNFKLEMAAWRDGSGGRPDRRKKPPPGTPITASARRELKTKI